MDASVLIALLTPALFHLGARATLTAPLHRRYPSWLSGFMNCAACSGTWYGVACAVGFLVAGWRVFGSTSWWMVPVVGLTSCTWTPIAASFQERALAQLSGEAPAITVYRGDAAPPSDPHGTVGGDES